LVPEISLSYLSGFKRINKRSTLAASLRYFSLGEIQFTDNTGAPMGKFTPNEFAIYGAYAMKLLENFFFWFGNALYLLKFNGWY